MKIIKMGIAIKDQVHRAECPICFTEFEFGTDEAFSRVQAKLVVVCPLCAAKVVTFMGESIKGPRDGKLGQC